MCLTVIVCIKFNIIIMNIIAQFQWLYEQADTCNITLHGSAQLGIWQISLCSKCK